MLIPYGPLARFVVILLRRNRSICIALFDYFMCTGAALVRTIITLASALSDRWLDPTISAFNAFIAGAGKAALHHLTRTMSPDFLRAMFRRMRLPRSFFREDKICIDSLIRQSGSFKVMQRKPGSDRGPVCVCRCHTETGTFIDEVFF
ncbi:MAG: hypothetical protein ACI9ZF_002876 [Bradyrhizobium sp.]|jgi:hypothetical protein